MVLQHRISPTPVSSIVVPDRYESLERKAHDRLNTIVVPIESGLDVIDGLAQVMERTDRGAFLLLQGASGAGKSTFLHTLGLHRVGVVTTSVPGGEPIRAFLGGRRETANGLDVLVLEEREAATGHSDAELEDWLHAINGFIRSVPGRRTLVVWPCNAASLRDRIVILARTIGGSALLGTGQGWEDFSGPNRSQYLMIAERTLAALNQGATFSDLGLSTELLQQDMENAPTIGDFLTGIHERITQAGSKVRGLIGQEQCRLWIVVAAGNDIASEVAALTRGRSAATDTERLLASTEANIVNELRRHPDQIGILGTTLDAKILHLPVLAASAISRAFADDRLKTLMKGAGLQLKPDDKADALSRLDKSELATLLKAGRLGAAARSRQPGTGSINTFIKLAEIASK